MMAVNGVRELIVDSVEEESLGKFHKACALTDKLCHVMERATDDDKAYVTCIAWGHSVLELARIEARLLAAVLPIYESELEELIDKIAPLIRQRTDAREAVREFRGPSTDIQPLYVKRNSDRPEKLREAREHAKTVSMEVLAGMQPIQAEIDEVQSGIGAIERSLRVLAHFAEHKFPIPQRKPSLRGQSTSPSGQDPIETFAKNYVANRGKVDARLQAIRAARAQPLNKFDRHGQEIVH